MSSRLKQVAIGGSFEWPYKIPVENSVLLLFKEEEKSSFDLA